MHRLFVAVVAVVKPFGLTDGLDNSLSVDTRLIPPQ